MGPVPIIIPVFGKLDYLEKCILSIWENTSLDYQLILIDDVGNPPVTIEWLRSLEGYSAENPPLLISHDRNKGYTRAVNTGIRYALFNLPSWDFLVLGNSDIQVQPKWLEAFKETVDNAKDVGVVGAKLLSMDDPDLICHGGTLDLLGTHKAGRVSQGHCDKRTNEVWVTGACIAVTRECIITCGLLDNGFRNFASDSSFCLTARMRGFRVIYQPKCHVIHKQSATVSEAVDNRSLAADQQRLLDLHGGQMLQNLVKELPFGISRNMQQR